jgi:tRNA (cytidine/uridine-2'-O-)-methyltransferase
MQVCLYQPEIAQNVGAVIRTCVCFGRPVHLVEPMGFVWDEPRMRRAGMDYLERAALTRHKSWAHFAEATPNGRLVALTKFADATLDTFTFAPDDILLFGNEGHGLPPDVHAAAHARVRIPMVAGERSLNLAQSVAMALFTGLMKTGQLPQT